MCNGWRNFFKKLKRTWYLKGSSPCKLTLLRYDILPLLQISHRVSPLQFESEIRLTESVSNTVLLTYFTWYTVLQVLCLIYFLSHASPCLNSCFPRYSVPSVFRLICYTSCAENSSRLLTFWHDQFLSWKFDLIRLLFTSESMLSSYSLIIS